ncbi:fructose-specific PTS transporter subunit EIIC [Staphylococcus massiliensis]|uniref:PTS fructose transporter subunit IIABC n=1 Tax=Staphylococcus massiliensis TaxID=555791 RepID=UPI001EDEAD6D|nr:fructose-specific PTS transporter subunit EIIC [Staphylococcus massiliensis]MCG3413171.1 fructose-specific PTS transporter subunit EIIC [Staphylococcus massiliensis]
MKITDLLTKDTVSLNVDCVDKDGVITYLVNQLKEANKISDVEKFKQAILKREQQSTTGVGDGIAIPHAKVDVVEKPSISFCKSEKGIDFDSLDGQPAHLFFMIAAPENGAQTHLDALAKLSGLLMKDNVKQALLSATSKDEVIEIFRREESDNNVVSESQSDSKQEKPFIVAVTACPTGIAHTYMAKDALLQEAEKMNVDLKVETNGSSGVKNKLTNEDIDKALGVIVAADVKVDIERFDGKNLVEVPVSDGIKRPHELIEIAQDQNRQPYKAKQNQSSSSKYNDEKLGIGKTIYKHLMNGVSNMLPLVIAGGILMAIVFMFGENAFDPKHSQYNAFAANLWEIGKNSAFQLIIPILAGFIARSIADKPGFAAGLVGGMLATSGGSGFIGAILAGFLAGYLTQSIKKLCRNLPHMLEGLKPTLIYPLLTVTITGLLMIYAINPPAAWLNDQLQGLLNGLAGANIIILGIVLGAMMAIDMGGPFNKAAYVFSIAALESGNAAPITAAMVGGMVPPIALATSMLLFKGKYTKAQRGSIIPNYVMGLSFITEGAIPFAAADPLRVIPSMMVGSGVAGGIALGLGSNIAAPHGGIFVIFGTDFSHAFQTLLAIVIGSLVGAIIYGILKPKLTSLEINSSKNMDN